MPKVSKEYFVEKKKLIVDAAIKVCAAKPAYAVTMRDVVKQSGISQGGIYNYFSNIDEIFAEILNRCYREHTISERVDEIFMSDHSPDKIIAESFSVLGKAMDNLIGQYGNLIYELNTIYISEPMRGEKAQKMMQVSSEVALFLDKQLAFISSLIEAGSVKPIMPKEQILLFIGVSIEGITKAVTISQQSSVLQERFGVTEDLTTAEGMMGLLAQTVNNMLRQEA